MVKAEIIFTDRLVLEPISSNDIDSIYELAKDKKSIEDFQYVAGSKDEVKEWLEPSINDYTIFSWVIKENQRIIGMVEIEQEAEYSEKITNTARIGYFIDYKRQNNGFGTEALKAAINWLFENTELSRIEAGVTINNIPSYKILEKIGFVRDKIVKGNWKWYDKYYDSAYYYLLKPSE